MEVIACVTYLTSVVDEEVKGAIRLQQALTGMGSYTFQRVAQEIVDRRELQVCHTAEGPTRAGNRVSRKVLMAELKAGQHVMLKETLGRKKIHGVFAQQVAEETCDQKATHAWLLDGRLQSVTEGLIIPAQDGIVHTRAYRMRILK